MEEYIQVYASAGMLNMILVFHLPYINQYDQLLLLALIFGIFVN